MNSPSRRDQPCATASSLVSLSQQCQHGTSEHSSPRNAEIKISAPGFSRSPSGNSLQAVGRTMSPSQSTPTTGCPSRSSMIRRSHVRRDILLLRLSETDVDPAVTILQSLSDT